MHASARFSCMQGTKARDTESRLRLQGAHDELTNYFMHSNGTVPSPHALTFVIFCASRILHRTGSNQLCTATGIILAAAANATAVNNGPHDMLIRLQDLIK